MNDDHGDELGVLLEEFSVNPYWAQFLLREWMERGPDGLPDALLLGHTELQSILGRLETPPGIDIAAAWVNLNLSLLVTLASSVHEERISRVSGDAHIGLNRRLSSIRQLYRLLRSPPNR